MISAALARYFDVESHIVEAIVAYLEAQGLEALPMFGGEMRDKARVEVLANLVGPADHDGISPGGEYFVTGHQIQLVLDLRTPLKDPSIHAPRRGLIRAALSRPMALPALRPLCPYGAVVEIAMAETANELLVDDDEQDELSTTLSYQLVYALHAGAWPTA